MKKVPDNFHPDVAEAFQQIDASMFSGDTFHFNEAQEYLQYFIDRWQQGLAERRGTWFVGRNNGPDGQPEQLKTFQTFDEVMDYFDKDLMDEDPDGVQNGDYYIDGPEEN